MPRLLSQIRPDERRSAGAAFLTLFGILAAHTMLETARDALFLARLPPSQLAWVYLAMAGIAIGIAQMPGHGRRRMARRYTLPLSLVGLAVATVAFYPILAFRSANALRAFYVWTGLVGTTAGLQFWLVMGEAYTITQAKRLFRVIGTGSLVGAVAGAGLARVLSTHAEARVLVLAAALILAVTGLGPAVLLRATQGPASPTSPGEQPWRATLERQILTGRQILTRQPYLTRLTGMLFVSTVAVTLADYCFKSAVARHVPADHLGPFFAGFYMILNLLALLTQLSIMGWLLRTIGLHRTLWVLPVLLMFGAAGVAFGGGLLAALLLKSADGALRPSVQRTGTELLFVPIPDSLRARTKPFIDVIGQRGGQALASIFILSELSMHRGDSVLAAGAAGLCVVWIAILVELRPHYLELFRAALREGSVELRGAMPELDLNSLEALFASLNSRDDHEVLDALALLEQQGRGRIVPALVLYHPSPTVVVRALAIFSRVGRTDFVPLADRLLEHADPEIRAAALRARTLAQPDAEVLSRAMADPHHPVRATAVVGLLRQGWQTEEAEQALAALLESPALEARRALARAIEEQPGPAFEQALLVLAATPDPEVQTAAARALGALHDERHLGTLLFMLQHHAVRDSARDALLAYGEAGLQFLDAALGDPSLPRPLRRHLPRSISRFPPRAAADVLLRHLLQEQDGMVRFRILRGLGRIAAENPHLSLDRTVLRTATQRTVEAAFRGMHWRRILVRGAREDARRATPGHDLLVHLLKDKQVNALERLFRLLGLQQRDEDFHRLYHALGHPDPKVRASSRELLENLVRPPLRDALLGLVDQTSVENLPPAVRAAYPAPELGYVELLLLLLQSHGETLRSLAAWHIGELGLLELRGRLEERRAQETSLSAGRVMERSLRRLATGAAEHVAHAG